MLKKTGKKLAKKAGKMLLKKAGKMIFKYLFSLLLPLLPAVLLFLLAFSLISLLFGATYGAMTQGTYLTGVNPSVEDVAIKGKYESLAASVNVANTWFVDGEGSPDHPFYPGKGKKNFLQMVDEYGRDYDLRLLWSDIHSTALYWAYIFSKAEIPDDIRQKVADAEKPYYYYKESYVEVCGKDGCDKTIVYLLVEANTIKGWFQYHYEWVTETYGEGENAVTVTKEVLKPDGIKTLAQWERMEKYLQEFYRVKPGQDLALVRVAVMEASKGFDEKKMWLDWLLNRYNTGDYVSYAMIPPELLPAFKQAEEKYHIPAWFLAAVVWQESRFNIYDKNNDSGAYGLMQVLPSNWKAYASLLGFDVNADVNNPLAQIMVGAYILAGQGLGNINWESDWREASLPALVFYGGFRGSDAVERCRREYAAKIWDMAAKLQGGGDATWPLSGYYIISSAFGWRVHPILSKRTFHDGIDIPAPEGTNVLSVSAGVVADTDYGPAYGNQVVIRDGVHEYLYAHLSQKLVSPGQTVQPGMVIGRVGSTGTLSTGPHLHFGVKPIGGNWINPLLIVKPK